VTYEEDKAKFAAEQLRARELLRQRGTTAAIMKSEIDYYREREADPHETKANRALWKQLADELESRVKPKKPQPSEADEPLFE
jgi:hypothetical protein